MMRLYRILQSIARAAIVVGLLFCCIRVQADEARALFEKANEAYRNGEIDQAIEGYETVLLNGYISHELYYNLGNAYFKLNNIPAAILSYERAKKLAPDDEDIEFNLRVANLQIVDKIEPLPTLFWEDWWASIRSLLAADGWAYVALACVWAALALFITFLWAGSPAVRKPAFLIGLAVSVGFAIALTLSIQQHEFATAANAGIIFEPTVYVKSSPDDSGTDLFILHEGAKVEIVDSVGEWLKIRLADGNVGWFESKYLRVI